MSARRWAAIACLFAGGTGVAVATAQIAAGVPPFGRPPTPMQPVRPGMRPPEPPEPAQELRPTFRTRAELIEVAVVATDADDRFVADLTEKDFTLLEQGKPQARHADVVAVGALDHQRREEPVDEAADAADRRASVRSGRSHHGRRGSLSAAFRRGQPVFRDHRA